MLAWWVKWAKEGTLGHNLAAVAHLRISPAWHHPDNFTVALTHLGSVQQSRLPSPYTY